jgi:hypothetical protein
MGGGLDDQRWLPERHVEKVATFVGTADDLEHAVRAPEPGVELGLERAI